MNTYETSDYQPIATGDKFKEAKILLVDDEQDVLDILRYNLEKEGYSVYTCNNGASAIEMAKELKPRLIVLDVMMPYLDGIETCIKLRKNPETERSMIAFLSARSEEYTKIACLEAGADYFINKPIKPRLLLSHVRALLRRYFLLNEAEVNRIIKVNDVILNLETYQCQVKDRIIELTKKEFELLHLFMKNPQKVLTREEIFRKVWGNDVVVGKRTIDVHISRLREKIGKTCIIAVKKVGYRFSS